MPTPGRPDRLSDVFEVAVVPFFWQICRGFASHLRQMDFLTDCDPTDHRGQRIEVARGVAVALEGIESVKGSVNLSISSLGVAHRMLLFFVMVSLKDIR